MTKSLADTSALRLLPVIAVVVGKFPFSCSTLSGGRNQGRQAGRSVGRLVGGPIARVGSRNFVEDRPLGLMPKVKPSLLANQDRAANDISPAQRSSSSSSSSRSNGWATRAMVGQSTNKQRKELYVTRYWHVN